MLGGFIRSNITNTNTKVTPSNNNITPPEVEAWKLILESGSMEIMEIIIRNKFKTATDFRDASDKIKEDILEKYKILKSSSEYDHLKDLVDHFDVHHHRSVLQAGYELVGLSL